MSFVPRSALPVLALGLALVAVAGRTGSTSAGPADLGAQVEALVREGAVSLARVQVDPDFPGRRHLRFDQRVDGVRVFGAQLVQQVGTEGQTLSVSGRIDVGLSADVDPRLDAEEAIRAVEPSFARGTFPVGEPELVLLDREGPPVLVWTLWMRFDHHLERVFVDARTGDLVWSYSDLRSSAEVGVGRGVWGDQKKVSAESGPDGFRANDRLRPPALATWDLGHDLGPTGAALASGELDPAWIAVSPDNTWSDGAVVDAHVHAGWTYDYFFHRYGRRGIDDHDLPIRSVTHFLPRSQEFANAFWDPFSRAVYYGDGDGSFAPFSGALDVAVHELTHGVTQHTWDGVYAGESGALDEAFSDIMATGAEFFHQPPGGARLHADYFLGEDLPFVYDPPRTAIRSMENPALFCSEELDVCDADHYSLLYRGPRDNGGVHHNSGVANQAFYLLVEGGVNRTSGRRVTGLGPERRAEAEHVFYRAFTLYLTPSATFADARTATVQAALDLYGEAVATEVEAAWSAVGLD
jgi:bacillolysin